MMMMFQEQMHRMHLSHTQPPAPVAALQQLQQISVTSLVQSGQSFFHCARPADVAFPETMEDWEVATSSLVDPNRKTLTQA